MSTFQQFRDLPNPTDTFDKLFRDALVALLPDLARCPWYVREHEVVNIFVFQHLIPQFQAENLDIGQLGIEVPVLTLKDNSTPRGRHADIVVWPHNEATRWRTCRPLAHIEWKNISCREENPRTLKRLYDEDVRDLKDNREFACVSYAVLTEWHPFPRERRMGQRDWHVEMQCKRISDRGEQDLFSERPRFAAACPEKAVTELQRSLKDLLSRPQGSACPLCGGRVTRSEARDLRSRPVPRKD